MIATSPHSFFYEHSRPAEPAEERLRAAGEPAPYVPVVGLAPSGLGFVGHGSLPLYSGNISSSMRPYCFFFLSSSASSS